MRDFGTLVRASLAGVLLVGVSCVAPASATIVSTTTWETYNQQAKSGNTIVTPGCFNANGVDGNTNSQCVGDSGSRTKGNEYGFSPSGTGGSSTGGILTAAAYQLKSTGLAPDFLGFYAGADYGLGVGDQAPPEHSVDNQNTDQDFVVFKLPSGANTISVILSAFDTTEDMDATIFWGTPTATSALANQIASNTTSTITGALAFTGVTVAELTAANSGFYETQVTGLFDETGTAEVTVSGPQMATYVIVAASLAPQLVSYANNPQYSTKYYSPVTHYEIDDFKINTIIGAVNNAPPRGPRCTLNIPPSGKWIPCPEPASLAMFGGGILGLGMMARRRKAVRAA